MPTYNRATFLAETIASALAQTVADLEVVVCDDNSPDDTPAVVGKFSDPRVRCVRNATNLGVPENYNRVFALGRAEFLVLLGDHDVLEKTYLEATLDLMCRHPEVVFVFTGLIMINDCGQPVRKYVSMFPDVIDGRTFLRRLLSRTTCPFSFTTLIRRSALRGLEPPFDPRYAWFADQNLWMRLCTRGAVGYVAQPLLKVRMREDTHTLTGKDWEGLLCVDRINRDNRALLYRGWTVRSALDGLWYEAAKVQRVVSYRMAKSLRGDAWNAEDRKNTSIYLASPGRIMVALAGVVPRLALRVFRQLYKRYAKLR